VPNFNDPFFAPDKSYDFFYHQARKIFFFKKLTMFVSFPEAIQKKDPFSAAVVYGEQDTARIFATH